MGLMRDQESELPMLRRFVARLQDPARRCELSAEEWPTALIAYSLHLSEDPALLGDEARSVYADFVRLVPAPARESSLTKLAAFVSRSQGAGWRALLLYAVGETAAPAICARAATLAATLAPPAAAGQSPLVGAAAIVALAEREPAAPAMLSALLSLPDLRLLPALEPLATLPPQRLAQLIAGLSCPLNSLSAACMLHLLDTHPTELAPGITAALAAMAKRTPLVADIALPLPTWAFASPTPQPLHAWSLPEYLPRLLPRLKPHLTPAHLATLHSAFV